MPRSDSEGRPGVRGRALLVQREDQESEKGPYWFSLKRVLIALWVYASDQGFCVMDLHR